MRNFFDFVNNDILFKKKRRDLDARELRNIEKFKIDEIVSKEVKVSFILEILNSFSPRFSSFLNPAFLNF
jgi:hypothetical protein